MALCSLLAMSLTVTASAAEVSVDESVDDDGAGARRVFRLSARLAPGQVMVLHTTRWEDGVKVLEIEEVRGDPSGMAMATVAFGERAPNRWHLAEADAEQHLQGLRIVRREATRNGLVIELEPAPGPGSARRHYRFQWEVRVEARRVVQQRHPGLPAAKAAAAWVHRRLLFPVLPAR